MKSELVIFLTHNFPNNFISQLKKIDRKYNDREIIILYDNDTLPTKKYFSHIKIIPNKKIKSSYDNKGHTLYLSFFKQNYETISKFKYFWIIENDVHFQCGIDYFIDKHKHYNNDVLVPEYGLRDISWCHTKSLVGFEDINYIGILGVVMRFSKNFLTNLINNIDKTYFGYMEAIIPHICKKYNFDINKFLPELLGIMNTYGGSGIELVKKDIINNTSYIIENKIYHPIKL